MRFHKALTVAATLALSSALTLTATTTPAHAAPTCSKGSSADLHTAWIDCDNGFTTGMFRLKALFCSGTGCSWRYGPDRYYQGTSRSSFTSSLWVDVNNITYEDRGPGSLAPAS